MIYAIYEKSTIERFDKIVEDEVNVADSNTVDGVLKFFKDKRKLNVSKRQIYRAIKYNMLVHNKYYIYKIKERMTSK